MSRMPCDNDRPNQNIIEYKSVLNDIITLSNGADAHYVIVGGDFNTDLSRTFYFTRHFMEYVKNKNMYLCVKDKCNTVKHTYYSKSTDARSLIDHIFVSENCCSLLLHYDEVHGHNNVSDHC